MDVWNQPRETGLAPSQDREPSTLSFTVSFISAYAWERLQSTLFNSTNIAWANDQLDEVKFAWLHHFNRTWHSIESIPSELRPYTLSKFIASIIAAVLFILSQIMDRFGFRGGTPNRSRRLEPNISSPHRTPKTGQTSLLMQPIHANGQSYGSWDDLRHKVDALGVSNSFLKQSNDEYQNQIRALNARIISLEQGQDYRAKRGAEALSYDAINKSCVELNRKLCSWADSICSIAPGGPKPTKAALELPQMSRICSQGMTPEMLERLDVSLGDMITAAVSEQLYSTVVVHPLSLCTEKFRDELQSPLWRQLEQHDGQIAKSCLARCLKIYNRADVKSWKPYFSAAEEKANSAKAFTQKACDDLIESVRQICASAGVGQIDIDAAKSSLLPIVEFAADTLARPLGQLASGHELVNKSWLCAQTTQVAISDSRIKIQGLSQSKFHMVADVPFAEECEYIILAPGLLKWGRENGESWDSWDVYAPMDVMLFSEWLLRTRRADGKAGKGAQSTQERPRRQSAHPHDDSDFTPYPEDLRDDHMHGDYVDIRNMTY